MPPRHGKSELTSHWFPVWYLDHFPDRNIILTSYEADFASNWGRRVRNSILEHSDQLRVRISEDSAAANRWVTTEGGGMVTAGIGGPITGRGAHVLIIDDPVKNAEEAHSKTYRDRAWEWFISTAYTRLEPGGSVIIVMTRWHEDDLVGRVLSMTDEVWEEVKLPAIAEENDPIGRKPGEALWPERYDENELKRIKNTVGSYVWNALYQQKPSPAEGGIFKRSWWKYYSEPPGEFDEIIQSWDMTFKDTDTSDYVVGQVWGKKGANKYLLDQVRAKMDFPTTIQALRNLSAKWPKARAKLVEDTANGPAVIATLRKEIPGLIPVTPQGSKEARAYAVSPQVEAGNVYIPDPRRCPWVNDFIEECAAFPNGANDDQVDAMTQALLRFELRAKPGIIVLS